MPDPSPPPALPGAGVLGLVRRAGTRLARLPKPLTWGLTLAWAVLIWSLSDRTLPSPEGGGPLWHVIANGGHAPLFGILALLLLAAVVPASESAGWNLGARRAALVLGAVALYGLADEWHQSTTPGRHPSPHDLLTDLVGAAAVLWVAAYAGRSGAREGGVRIRLLVGGMACVGAALLAARGSA